MTKAPPQQQKDEREVTRAVFDAAADGDAAEVGRLLASGAAADARLAAGGETPLMRAAARGHEEVARMLLDAGADASARRADGFTPLILAVFFGHERVARLLVERGADACARTNLGTTPARWAASRGFKEMAEFLRAAAPASPQAVEAPGARLVAPGVETNAATAVSAATLPSSFAGGAAPASDEVSIFSRKAEPRDSRASASARAVATSRVAAAAARAAAEDQSRPAVVSTEGARREAPSVEFSTPSATPSGVTLRLGGHAPAHPSVSAFKLGDFLRSWQGSVGAAMLLLALGVAVFALVSGGADTRRAAAPAPTPTPAAPQSAAQTPPPVAQPTPAFPTPDPQGVMPVTDPALVAPGAAGQPFYVPQPAPYVPAPSDAPRDLMVVTENGAPPANDNAGARRRAEQNANNSAPPRNDGRREPAPDADPSNARPARTPAPEPQRPAPPAAQPNQPPASAPQPTPARPKVIQWPPQ